MKHINNPSKSVNNQSNKFSNITKKSLNFIEEKYYIKKTSVNSVNYC